jgi:O-antigen/teichoic acid export membrane protein
MLLKRNKDLIHFSGRRHTKMGIISTVIGIAVVLGFITISLVSGLAQGKGTILLGVIGILLFGLSVFGFVLSYKSFKKKDIFYRFPIIGAVLNGIMTILFLVIYIVGIAL